MVHDYVGVAALDIHEAARLIRFPPSLRQCLSAVAARRLPGDEVAKGRLGLPDEERTPVEERCVARRPASSQPAPRAKRKCGVIEKRQRRGRDGRRYTVYRVRWHDADGAERNKTLPRGSTRRDAEAFERRVYMLKRIGELDVLDRGRETLAEFAEEWWELYAGEPRPRDPRALRRGLENTYTAASRARLSARALARARHALPARSRAGGCRRGNGKEGTLDAPGHARPSRRVAAHRFEPGRRGAEAFRQAAARSGRP
jgi:hypothetical protein